MKILFLTNNVVSYPLIDWLEEQGVTVEFGDSPLTHVDADLIISYSYRQIIPKSVLDQHPNKFINLHISYLPFNRGADPIMWSVLEGTQSGVSIHLIDEGVDTGAIIAQEKVEISDDETLASAFDLLHNRIQELFKTIWPSLKDGSYIATKQTDKGTYHSKLQGNIVKIELLKNYEITLTELKKQYAIKFNPMLCGDVFK